MTIPERLKTWLPNWHSDNKAGFGLSENETKLLIGLFSSVPQVREVFVYGSRAKGNYKRASDIDLAVRFTEGFDGENMLRSRVDDLPLIYKVDIIDESRIPSGVFRDEYEKTKKSFYRA